MKKFIDTQKLSKFNLFTYFFLISFVCWGLNISFNLNSLEGILKSHWQILDLPTLFSEPFESILFLHSQPPLLNIVIFLMDFIKGHIYDNFVILNSILIGAIASLILKILFDITKKLFMSIILSFCYVIFPTTLLNVGYPFYQCISAFGYMLLIYSFHLTNYDKSRAYIYFFFSCLLLSLTRSSFTILHTLSFIIIFYYYIFSFKLPSKKFLMTIFFTFIFSIIIPVKNLILYDFFGTSSWAPLNISKGLGIPRQDGYMISPNKILNIYPSLKCENSYHSQDTRLIKGNGEANYNSCIVLEYSKIVKKEKLKGYSLIKHSKRVLSNTVQYFSPSDKYFFLKNRDSIEPYANFINYLQLSVPITSKRDSRNLLVHEIRFTLILILSSALFYSFIFRDKFLLICLILVMIHFFTHALTDGSEGKRFVFDVEFIFFIMIGIVIKSTQKFKKINKS